MIKTTTNKQYIFTAKELKQKLGITGEIIDTGLYSGRNDYMKKQGKSDDKDEWSITTEETRVDK